MTLDGDYATPILTCSVRCGICFLDGKCGSCDFAKRHEINKRFFELIENCTYVTIGGDCKCNFKPCLGADCWRMMKIAEQEINDGRTSV